MPTVHAPSRCSLLIPRPTLRDLALATALALLAVPGAAQCEELSFHLGNFVCSPPGLSGTYGAVAMGDVTGDRSPEVATLKGSNLIVYHDPDVGNDAILIAENAIDVCFASASNEAGEPGFFYTASDGLHRVTFDLEDYAYVTELLDGSAAWQGARFVRASTGVGGGPREGLIGVKSDARTFMSALPAGDAFASPTVLFDPGVSVLDVALAQFAVLAPGPVDIAFLHAGGVQIRGQSGIVLGGRTGTVPGDAIAVVRSTGHTDALAWVTRVASGTSNLLLLRYQQATQVTTIGVRVYSSMTAGDLDADGDDDLVLGAATWTSLDVRRCDPSAPKWFELPAGAPNETVHVSLDGASGIAVPSMGRVLCADLFNDKDANGLPAPAFAIALPSSDGLRLMPQVGVREATSGTAADFDAAVYRSAVGPTCGGETLPLSVWTTGLGGGWGTTNATHYQMVVKACSSNLASMHALYTATVPITEGEIDDATPTFEGEETDADPEDSNQRYFVQVRPVRIEDGNVVHVWRWSILGMSATCEGMNWLRHLPGAGEQPAIPLEYATCSFAETSCDSGPGSVTRYIPSAVPQSRIPSPGPGVIIGPPH